MTTMTRKLVRLVSAKRQEGLGSITRILMGCLIGAPSRMPEPAAMTLIQPPTTIQTQITIRAQEQAVPQIQASIKQKEMR